MQALSRSSEHAIRALTWLAQRRDEEGFHLTREMAEEVGIPAPFLGKLLQQLVARGWVASQRGRGGGFRLTAAPDSVALLDVVGAFEGGGQEGRCILGQHVCSDEAACPLHEYWKQSSALFQSRLAGTTVADLVAFARCNPGCGYP